MAAPEAAVAFDGVNYSYDGTRALEDVRLRRAVPGDFDPARP